jgi:signal transduction histidine kinase
MPVHPLRLNGWIAGVSKNLFLTARTADTQLRVPVRYAFTRPIFRSITPNVRSIADTRSSDVKDAKQNNEPGLTLNTGGTAGGAASEPNAADALPPRSRAVHWFGWAFPIRGERAVARAGLMVAILLVTCLVAGSWWTLATNREVVAKAREKQLRSTADLLARSAEGLLTDGTQLSALRRMISESTARYDLRTCRVVFADGSVIADGDAGRITAKVAPEVWPPAAALDISDPTVDNLTETTVETTGGRSVVRAPIVVAGRGRATLELSSSDVATAWGDRDVQMGLGVVAAGGLFGLLLVYRSMRNQLSGLGAIRDALTGVQSEDAGSMLMSPSLGEMAEPWNMLVEDAMQWRRRQALSQAAERVGKGTGGDLGGAVDALMQGVAVIGPDLRIKYANGAIAIMLRAKREDMVGSDLSRFLNEPKALAPTIEVATGRSRHRVLVEYEVGKGSERTVLRVAVKPLKKDESAGAVLVLEDVTQQRLADESRNGFVAQATHELRTPLTNIRLYTETLVDDDGADPSVRTRCLNVISTESRRLERIVADMLSVSEIEAGSLKLRPGDVRLDAFFEEVQADFKAAAEDKDIKFTVNLPPKLPVLIGDRDKLVLATHNLIGNAIKYTPAGGNVTVTVGSESGMLTIDVTDSGIGIKPEEHELVFEKFYRAKDKRITGITGSGLGLALARQVVRMHGGDITVKSEIDKGSTFTLSVPINDRRTAKAA